MHQVFLSALISRKLRTKVIPILFQDPGIIHFSKQKGYASIYFTFTLNFYYKTSLFVEICRLEMIKCWLLLIKIKGFLGDFIW